MANPVRVALVQMNSGVNPDANFEAISGFARAAADKGAVYVQTPEMSLAFARDRAQLAEVAGPFEEAEMVPALGALARDLGIHLHIGSAAFALPDGHFANRALLFGPDGKLVAHYDKIHLFDADPPGDRPYRESATYGAGNTAMVASAGPLKLGFGICFDMRFPALFAALAEAGADVLTAPAAFTVPTGQAHWHALLRARAIETGSFMLAAAQGGQHENGRATFGHSIVIDPWGRVLAEKDDDAPGLVLADLDLGLVADARQRLPVLANRRPFSLSVNLDPA